MEGNRYRNSLEKRIIKFSGAYDFKEAEYTVDVSLGKEESTLHSGQYSQGKSQ